MVILEKPAQALAADNDSDFTADLWPWLQDLMVQPLVRTLAMIMKQKLGRGITQRRLAKQDQSRECFLFEGSEEALQMGVTIRALRWQQHWFQFGSSQNCLKFRRELRVTVQQHMVKQGIIEGTLYDTDGFSGGFTLSLEKKD